MTAEIERKSKDLPFIKQTLKSTLLVRCQQKAERVGAKALVVAKGFPDKTLKDLARIAAEMGITLVDEQRLPSEFERILVQATMRATTSRTPIRSPDELNEAVRLGRFGD